MKTKSVLCGDCPCLNQDNEDGPSCNLGFVTDYVWIEIKTGIIHEDNQAMRSHQRDFDLCNVAHDCQLVSIHHTDTIFKPALLKDYLKHKAVKRDISV